MNIRPVGDLIIVKRLEKETVSKGGIILPNANQKSLGVVVAVGDGILNKKTGKYNNYNIHDGDIVVFQTHRGYQIKDGNEDFLFLGMKSVLCIYKKEDLIDGKMDININVNRSYDFKI